MRGRPRVPCAERRWDRRGCACADCRAKRRAYGCERNRAIRRNARIARVQSYLGVSRAKALELISKGFDLRRRKDLTHRARGINPGRAPQARAA